MTDGVQFMDSNLGQEHHDAWVDVWTELDNARAKFPAMHSAHEGYGVLMEEVDELWDHIKVKQKNRDLEGMRKEAIQVAAMAISIAAEVCNEEVGRR